MLIGLVRKATYTKRHMYKLPRLTSSPLVVHHLIERLSSVRRSMDDDIPVKSFGERSYLQLPSPGRWLCHVFEVDFVPIFVHAHSPGAAGSRAWLASHQVFSAVQWYKGFKVVPVQTQVLDDLLANLVVLIRGIVQLVRQGSEQAITYRPRVSVTKA